MNVLLKMEDVSRALKAMLLNGLMTKVFKMLSNQSQRYQ
jgi:hypothetical protein